MHASRVTSTGEPDVFCLCAASESRGSVFTGHSSRVKLWSPDGELLHSFATPTQGDVTCIDTCSNHVTRFAVSVDSFAYYYDIRKLSQPLQTFAYNRDDINQLLIHRNGEFLAICDDSGDIQIVNIEDGRIFKTCRGPGGGHENICSTVTFHPKRPWELISGGLDCRVIQWDFSRGRPCHKLNMQEIVGRGDSGAYLVNPPMVHSISCLDNEPLMVCGLGNGMVVVFDISKKKHMTVLCSVDVHASAVGCVQYLAREEGRDPCIVSGGNDSKLVVSRLVEEDPKGATPGGSSAAARQVKLVELSAKDHGYKINWLTTVPSPSSPSCDLAVADQTSNITTYSIK